MTEQINVGQLILLKVGRDCEDKAETVEEQDRLRKINDAYLKALVRRKKESEEGKES